MLAEIPPCCKLLVTSRPQADVQTEMTLLVTAWFLTIMRSLLEMHSSDVVAEVTLSPKLLVTIWPHNGEASPSSAHLWCVVSDTIFCQTSWHSLVPHNDRVSPSSAKFWCAGRVAKCHRYGRYIYVKVLEDWGIILESNMTYMLLILGKASWKWLASKG